MNVLIWLLTAVHIIVALLLVVLVLMQKSQDQGVGAAFGGGMTESVFGAGTTTALVRITVWCATIMLVSTLILAVLHSRRGGSETLIDKTLKNLPVSTMPAAQPQSLGLPPIQPTETPAPAEMP